MHPNSRLPALAPLFVVATAIAPATPAVAQTSDALVGAMELREVGPAVAGGRISDIEVDPRDAAVWYVAAGSGGLWKTTNAGTTWTPVFDEQPSYSIGDVALDPTNPDVVWVGTGENVSGRHVAWGSGLYRSRDGGGTWESAGLPESEHIGKILVHPEDGDVLLVAAEGPLWSEGGERGVYRSADGGATWEAVLTVDEHTGATDLEFDPSDPEVVYAATFQRRRHVWGYLAGGPGSGVWKSTDGGVTWRELTRGLPSGDMGKIGLAVTPADPGRVYATIEAGPEERGFYRSVDRGESWERRNSYISGGTGPHYYQEIEASPADPELVIQMDVFFQITRDGGATFSNLGTGREKHSDNHALWIDPADTRHMLAGTDAGLYETFDRGASWKHFPNLPISQFYKVAVSSREPFYDLLGGAQDLGTLLGPSRTPTAEGIRNEDWHFPMGADGYGVQFDPTDPDLYYLMTQQGNLYRVHGASDEALQIQPQPAPGDPPERWNWDSPILVSPHDPARLYFASQRLWRSEDRGDSWTPVSGDLTTDTDRYTLPFMGRVWSLDALHDNGAMSQYATVTAISESPVTEGRLYVGTDDGLIHTSPDGGATWRAMSDLPEVPERSFINDVEAGQHGDGTVFVAADAHKVGDYRPFLFRSDDHGGSWRSITGDLPEETIVWAVQQDDVDPELLFAAAEWGLYVTMNGGENWHRLPGAPTIAFRDVKLHRRDDDVVGATFGRGFWILDDYAPLRADSRAAVTRGSAPEVGGDAEAGSAVGGVMPVRDAWWYVPNLTNQARGRPTLGSMAWTAPNPEFGATFTVLVPELPEAARDARREAEAALRSEGADVPFPGYEALRAENAEPGSRVHVRVTDAAGEPVRRVALPAAAGVHRVTWDLRRPPTNPIDLSTPTFRPPWAADPQGPLAPPGTYRAQLMVMDGSGARPLGPAQPFEVRPVPTAPPGTDFVAVAAFQHEVSELLRRSGIASAELSRQRERLRYMEAALDETPGADAALYRELDAARVAYDEVGLRLQGDRVRSSLNQAAAPSVSGRLGTVADGHWGTRMEPTETQRRNVAIAEAGLVEIERDLVALISGRLARLEEALAEAGAPWTPGRRIGG
ncbi:MAG: glycosyl hydrolase [Gemmatimonadota bacterium]